MKSSTLCCSGALLIKLFKKFKVNNKKYIMEKPGNRYLLKEEIKEFKWRKK